MVRRKRRNSDFDLSVEKIFDGRQVNNHERQVNNHAGQPTTRETEIATHAPTEPTPCTKKQKIQTEAQRIEALKKKKQERKQRQKEKKEEKQQQAEVAREQELAAKKLQEKKDQEIKKKVVDNSKEKPFTTINKGVQYQDVVVGKGSPVKDRKKVRVAYTLRAKNRYGKILDSSSDFGFRLGRGDVIDGWDIGLQGMRQGGKRYLIIPPQAGYGQQNIGAGPGGILFFEVAILAC